ncbi:GerA spore germination protein [Aneurinibacillus soli]|uniref:Spore germination protein XA n=1 Tax=Aneurinibacillus soli TaxID=1500254 RepID=A0A0U5BFD6_9BACL|nr:spore germination protein [Aneurinibacillus soli]PYE61876.1 GerA spore germination protein [Aneurinibacillus soli]BAU29692.1 Spore germination protein XA [Aneurinibacillus soli]
MNEQTLRGLFHKCEDITFQRFHFDQHVVLFIYCQGMVKNDSINTVILGRLHQFFQHESTVSKNTIQARLHVSGLQEIKTKEQAIDAVFSGKLLVAFMQANVLFAIDIADVPQRQPEETKTEVTINGPRDDFIEDITVNVALIRKRLRTTTLSYERFIVGKRTKTTVGVLYMSDIASPAILQQIKERLQAIDVDGIHSGNQLQELLNDHPYTLFPRYQYTGRPDFAVQGLLSGRFLILVDGIAYVIIAPANLFLLLKAGEDNEYTFLYNSFERVMRIFGVLAATLLPGFWVALTSFHQNQIPLTLLATVVESRRGVPLPSGLEAILMLLLFELFREAGMRLPMAIGQTLSVVGGLIMGDAAIRAGLTSPAMLVIIGASSVSTFTLVNQPLIGTITLLRFFILILSSIFGFPGFFSASFFILLYVARIRTFGAPYLGLATRVNVQNILRAVFRLPAQKYTHRPSALDPQDPTRTGENS